MNCRWENLTPTCALTWPTLEFHNLDYFCVTLLSFILLHTQARAHCRVAVATLNTLAGYIDWVSLVYITSGNCQLLEMLCLLLSEPELQLEAAECLLIAISRKVSHRGKKSVDGLWFSHNACLDSLSFQLHFLSDSYCSVILRTSYQTSLENVRQ